MLDSECLKSKKEVSDLKDQLAKDEHLIDELRQDNYNMKQRLVESEGQKEGAKREIQNLTRKLTETEEDNRVREKDFNAALDEAHRAEQKSADKVRKKCSNRAWSQVSSIYAFFQELSGLIIFLYVNN